jgi:hypothetical protein
MGKIRVRIKMEDFRLIKPNDASGVDEPYLMALYARIDRWLNDPAIPAKDKRLPIHYPSKMGHGDLGPESNGMKFAGITKVSVPAAIGMREMTLDTAHLDGFTPLLQQCAAVLGVIFMEEDASTSGQVKTVFEEAKKTIRSRVDFILAVLLGTVQIPAFITGAMRTSLEEQIAAMRADLLENGFDPNGIINTELQDRIIAAALPQVIGPAVGKQFIPGFELWNAFLSLVQGIDRDAYIGASGQVFPFFDLVGRVHAPSRFTFDTLQEFHFRDFITGEQIPIGDNSDDGRYTIDGTVQRIDVDEVPTLALLRGPNDRVSLVARRLDTNAFEMQSAEEFGKRFSINLGKMGGRAFRSGPGAGSSNDGKVQCIAGRINTDRFMFRFSRDAGVKFTPWRNVGGTRTFRGAPAVVVSPDGKKLYIVGRGEDDRYWFTRSEDGGGNWSAWQACGSATFKTSPAAVCVRELRLGEPPKYTIVVAGLRNDNRIWTTRFLDSGPASDEGWKFVGTGPNDSPTAGFNSAPSLFANLDGQILLVCRAANLRYWYANSFDRGRTFLVGTTWARIGIPGAGRVEYTDGERSGDLQRMFSAPAVVAREDMRSILIVGMSPTLGLWRNRFNRENPQTWVPTLIEPEPQARNHYY